MVAPEGLIWNDTTRRSEAAASYAIPGSVFRCCPYCPAQFWLALLITCSQYLGIWLQGTEGVEGRHVGSSEVALPDENSQTNRPPLPWGEGPSSAALISGLLLARIFRAERRALHWHVGCYARAVPGWTLSADSARLATQVTRRRNRREGDDLDLARSGRWLDARSAERRGGPPTGAGADQSGLWQLAYDGTRGARRRCGGGADLRLPARERDGVVRRSGDGEWAWIEAARLPVRGRRRAKRHCRLRRPGAPA